MNAIRYIIVLASIIAVVFARDYYNDVASEEDVYEHAFYESPWGNNKMTRRAYDDDLGKITPESSLMDIIKVIGRAIIIALRIAASQVVKGTTNILNNLGNHENGKINVSAETKLGHTVGRTVNTILSEFLRNRWNGLLSHVAQEASDRFVEGSQEFMARLTAA